MNTILPTTLVGSYPQPDWLIDRAKRAGRFPPRVRAKELWRVAPEWLEQGSGRRDASGDPRPGACGPGHYYRWRNAPRELLKPLCDGPRRHRHRQSRHGTGSQRAPESRAACCRQDTEAPSSPGPRCNVLACQYRPHDQDYGARYIHNGATGAERLL
jgi:hypothetical protein